MWHYDKILVQLKEFGLIEQCSVTKKTLLLNHKNYVDMILSNVV
jgi:hypothetical protein